MDKRSFLLSTLGIAAWSATGGARAQGALSSQPIRIILATPPGGASDAAARLLAQSLARTMGQPVLVENRPGGNGVPAMQAALAGPANGHVLLWAQASMASVPLLVRGAPIRSMHEFTPVSTVVHLVYGLLTHPRLPAGTVQELTAHLKAHPDRVSYGAGSLSEYLMTVQYLHATGARAVRVPYKGGAQLLPDLINGDIQFNLGPLAPALPHVRSGRLKLLATVPERNEAAPGIPSLAEAGVPTDSLPTWNGLVATPGTPREVAAQLAREVERALADPTLRKALEAQGFRVAASTPQQMERSIETATQVWRQFVRDYDIPQE